MATRNIGNDIGCDITPKSTSLSISFLILAQKASLPISDVIFDSIMNKLAVALPALCLGNLVSRHIGEATSAAGRPMSSTAFAVLCLIHCETTATMSDIQKEVGVGQSTLSATMKMLVTDGWLEVEEQKVKAVRSKSFRIRPAAEEKFGLLADAVEASLEANYIPLSCGHPGVFHFDPKTPFKKTAPAVNHDAWA